MNLLSIMLALWASVSTLGVGCAALIVLAELRMGAAEAHAGLFDTPAKTAINLRAETHCIENSNLLIFAWPMACSPEPAQPGLDTTSSVNKLPVSWRAPTRQSFSTP